MAGYYPPWAIPLGLLGDVWVQADEPDGPREPDKPDGPKHVHLWLDLSPLDDEPVGPPVWRYYDAAEDEWPLVGGADGGGGSVAVDDDGVEQVAAASRLDFRGDGVTVTNAGGTVARVTIPGGNGSDAGAYAETIGDDTETEFAVTHELDTTDVVVQLWDLTGDDPALATGDADSIETTDADTVTVTFTAAPDEDAYRVVVLASGGSSGNGGGGGASPSLRGIETIEDPATDVQVTHGLPRIPAQGELVASPVPNPDGFGDGADVGPLGFANLGVSTFDLVTDRPPGSGKHVTVAWQWTPADLAVPPDFPQDLALWLDATTLGLSDEDEVVQWDDLSGNDRHAVKIDATGPTYRTNAIGGLPAVRWNGTSRRLQAPTRLANSSTDDMTLFAVLVRADGSRRGIMSTRPNSSPNNGWTWHLWTNQNAAWTHPGHNPVIESTTNTVETGVPAIVGALRDGLDVTHRAGGGEEGSGTSNGFNVSSTDLRIGTERDEDHFNGDIGEILAYNRLLSGSEIADVETYLADKWSISLGS